MDGNRKWSRHQDGGVHYFWVNGSPIFLVLQSYSLSTISLCYISAQFCMCCKVKLIHGHTDIQIDRKNESLCAVSQNVHVHDFILLDAPEFILIYFTRRILPGKFKDIQINKGKLGRNGGCKRRGDRKMCKKKMCNKNSKNKFCQRKVCKRCKKTCERKSNYCAPPAENISEYGMNAE